MAKQERCTLCGCALTNQTGTYAKPTAAGRSHRNEHHLVAERFFGRSKNRRGTQRERTFAECPWGMEGEALVFCFECGEELLHNPVFLPQDIQQFAQLIRVRDLSEEEKPATREKLAGRIRLLHDVIAAGLAALMKDVKQM